MSLSLALGLHLCTLFAVALGLGLAVTRMHVRVNYTRKVFFFASALLAVHLTIGEASPEVRLLKGAIFLVFFGLHVAPLRTKSKFLRTTFASFDRPEDRPLTLAWLSTQTVATYLLIFGLTLVMAGEGREPLAYLVVSAASLGDGLAEPIGTRFGKHKYKTRALFTKQSFERSFEGSATVFVTSLVVLMLGHAQLQPSELLYVLLLMPALLTLTEAFAPHTWDNPFLYAVGGTVMYTAIA
jgi:dolichol kinase